MSAAAVIQGPWVYTKAVEANGTTTFDIAHADLAYGDVAYVQTYAGQPMAEQEAIVRMATAAPRMFAALIEIQARLMAHPAYLDLRDSEDCDISAEQLELASIVRVAREAAEMAVGS